MVVFELGFTGLRFPDRFGVIPVSVDYHLSTVWWNDVSRDVGVLDCTCVQTS